MVRAAPEEGDGASSDRGAWVARYLRVRADSEALCRPLAVEDFVIQTTAEASPAKWHLAHVTWFFETFILRPYLPGYREFDERFRVLFNSYYEQVGAFHPRAERGFLSRPTVEEVYRYRAHVDRHMLALLDDPPGGKRGEIAERLGIGLNHEQQHQELLLTDVKRNFSANPLRPAYRDDLPAAPAAASGPARWLDYPDGLVEIGARGGDGFAYDNERPRHRVWLEPFRLASRPVTNGDFLAFIDAGGYSNPALWLSDGWARVRDSGWSAPLYWERVDGDWWRFTLGGMRRVDPDEPVCHVSHFEADAFATWSRRRLPTEAEWEFAAAGRPVEGNFRDRGHLEPVPAAAGEGLLQVYGDVWEHTMSAYLPYPGFRTAQGALGEYNGKFMCGQMVLRGGSCVTPADHLRPTYRNFFYPHERWQFQGLRLADGIR